MKNSVLLCLMLLGLAAAAQQRPSPADLHLSYSILRNDVNGKRVFLSAFQLRNAGRQELPARGWSIFFSFPRMIHAASVSPRMKVEHINGDFYRLTPTSQFKGLAAQDTLRVEFLAGAWGTSITDAPGGVYLVWDDQPTKGELFPHYTVEPATRPEQYQRYQGDRYEPSTPELVFAENEIIRPLPSASLPKVFPTPSSYRESPGSFRLDRNTLDRLVLEIDSMKVPGTDLSNEAELLRTEISRLLQPTKSSSAGKLVLALTTKYAGEDYGLTVNSSGIRIEAGAPVGIFYGIQSLRSLIPPAVYGRPAAFLDLPLVEIVDRPRFGHRAFMLDVARNFQTKEQIFKTLDLMALYKMNVFHFHFSDDEGWRVEIHGLPELTLVGGRRGHALQDGDFLHPSFGSGPDLNSSGSGFYSRQDFVDILRYAHRRHIRVIPEIETPGHARAAIAAMDARYRRLSALGKKEAAEEFLLYDLADTSRYRSVQRWFRNVINPALPSTYRFLEKVVEGLQNMYAEAGAPLETIHFGGDEVPAGVWTGSPAAHRLIDSSEQVNEVNDLWYYYFDKVTAMMKKRGLYVYGWEEAGMRKTRLDGKPVQIPNPDFANTGMQVDVWNNVIGWGSEDLPYSLANAGYRVILSPVSNMYLDLAYRKDFNEPGQYWGGFVDVDKPFKFIPYDYYRNSDRDINGNTVDRSYFSQKERLTDYGRSRIQGIQGLLWAETLSSPEKMEYLMLPKLLAVAERAWAPDPDWAREADTARASALYRQAWTVFVNVLGQRELPRLDHLSGGYNYRIPTAGARRRNGLVEANSQFPGLRLRYTTNGREPSISSPEYRGPIRHEGPVRLRLFDSRGRGGRSTTVEPGRGEVF